MKRTLLILGAIFALLLTAAPAQAGVIEWDLKADAPVQTMTIHPSVYGCPNDTNQKGAICLYNYITYNSAGGVWKRAITDLGSSTDGGVPGCTNLNDQYWNGTSSLVYDAASSLIINASVPAPAGYVLSFYENINCNTAARYFYCFLPNQIPFVFGVQNLSNIPLGTSSSTCKTANTINGDFYDTIASIRLTNA